MIDMDKMVEVVARAIRNVNVYGEFDEHDDFAPHETLEGGEIIAQAAIKAAEALIAIDEVLTKEIEDNYENYTDDLYTHGYIDALTMIQKILEGEV